MSSSDTPTEQGASGSGSGSNDDSPTDTTHPRVYQSITREDNDEDAPPTSPDTPGYGTVRRNPAAALSPSRGAAHSYGSIGSAMLRSDEQSDGQRTPTQSNYDGGLSSPRSSRLHSVQSSEGMHTPSSSKPGLARRPSTSKHHPHKYQEFSVDDDADEYESDIAQRRGSRASKSSTQYGSRKHSVGLRRRLTNKPSLPRIDSRPEDVEDLQEVVRTPEIQEPQVPDESSDTANADDEDEDDDDDDVSDAESFTLKDKQRAINETHPFGIRIWKPALYKKNRSVEKNAEGDIHSSPGGRVSKWLAVFNVLWTVLFGWWLALAAGLSAVICHLFAFDPNCRDYGRVFFGLSGYLFYPFGKFVKLEQDEAYAEEDQGEGRSISEYEQWQQGDLEDGRLFFGPINSQSIVGRRRSIDSSETASLLGRPGGRRHRTDSRPERKARLFGRGQWSFGRVLFFIFFYFLLAPLLLLTSLICWFLIFWIPMGRTTGILFYHLRRHPLALSFHSDASYSRGRDPSRASSILLCTYRAAGTKYWKYTIDGTNIFLINLLGVVIFTIFDYFVLFEILHIDAWVTNPGFVFAMALFSIIPLAYFIGQAVASISAQSTMGVGAAINAFFSTIVEVFLYCVALNQGKGQLVEGSIIGSIFAGILFLPGLSMIFGAFQRKTQRFNVRSAGVTSTMLLFATIAAFAPTLFYQIYGSHELNCHACTIEDHLEEKEEDCRRCYFTQNPTITDDFFVNRVRPYCWFAAVLLFLSYLIGLWFTLRTHAAIIWNAEIEEKKAVENSKTGHEDRAKKVDATSNMNDSGFLRRNSMRETIIHRDPALDASQSSIRESQTYKRILSQTLKQDGIDLASPDKSTKSNAKIPHLVPEESLESVALKENPSPSNFKIPGLADDDVLKLMRHVAEIAATAAATAARDATRPPRERKPSTFTSSTQLNSTHRSSGAAAHDPNKASHSAQDGTKSAHPPQDPAKSPGAAREHEALPTAEPTTAGGHDAPNWGRTKSAVILLGATVLYAIIAEILVNTVDSGVLQNVQIDEKFLGITLFALVPNTTEFLNAISFAMNGNIALSMEIGSAYALQVCLLQIPALVLFSAITSPAYVSDATELINHTFSLIFPEFDMVTVILCVFLLSYVYGEGKSNYFKGSILCLTYFVIVVGFWLTGGVGGDVEEEMKGWATERVTGGKRFGTLGRRSGRAF